MPASYWAGTPGMSFASMKASSWSAKMGEDMPQVAAFGEFGAGRRRRA